MKKLLPLAFVMFLFLISGVNAQNYSYYPLNGNFETVETVSPVYTCFIYNPAYPPWYKECARTGKTVEKPLYWQTDKSKVIDFVASSDTAYSGSKSVVIWYQPNETQEKTVANTSCVRLDDNTCGEYPYGFNGYILQNITLKSKYAKISFYVKAMDFLPERCNSWFCQYDTYGYEPKTSAFTFRIEKIPAFEPIPPYYYGEKIYQYDGSATSEWTKIVIDLGFMDIPDIEQDVRLIFASNVARDEGTMTANGFYVDNLEIEYYSIVETSHAEDYISDFRKLIPNPVTSVNTYPCVNMQYTSSVSSVSIGFNGIFKFNHTVITNYLGGLPGVSPFDFEFTTWCGDDIYDITQEGTVTASGQCGGVSGTCIWYLYGKSPYICENQRFSYRFRMSPYTVDYCDFLWNFTNLDLRHIYTDKLYSETETVYGEPNLFRVLTYGHYLDINQTHHFKSFNLGRINENLIPNLLLEVYRNNKLWYITETSLNFIADTEQDWSLTWLEGIPLQTEDVIKVKFKGQTFAGTTTNTSTVFSPVVPVLCPEFYCEDTTGYYLRAINNLTCEYRYVLNDTSCPIVPPIPEIECETTADCPLGYYCDNATKTCKTSFEPYENVTKYWGVFITEGIDLIKNIFPDEATRTMFWLILTVAVTYALTKSLSGTTGLPAWEVASPTFFSLLVIGILLGFLGLVWAIILIAITGFIIVYFVGKQFGWFPR